MAIVEDVPESESGTGPGTYTSATAIPLRHPSELTERRRPEPLLRPPTPPGHVSGSKHAVVEDGDDDGGLAEEIFDTAMLTVPFSFLFLLLHILVHMQYSHRASRDSIVSGLLTAVPTLGITLFYANRYASHTLTRTALMSASVLSGARLIWLVNKASWSVVTAQAPAMGTIWILTIVQLPLSRCVPCLIAVGGWVWWTGMNIYP